MTRLVRFLAFAPLVLSSPLFSQTPDSASLREVVVQATRAGARTPVPHNNFKAEAILKTLHTQDVPYLLSATPSLVESSDGGTGTGYTGMRIRGSDQSRINVTINGVPLNDAESQSVFWVNLPDLAASASEIQVQRGVGSSTNGAGAFGATVNLDLTRVVTDPSASVAVSAGSFNTRRLSAQLHSGLLGRWAFSGRASAIESDGYIDRASASLRSTHLSGAYIGDKHTFQAHALLGKEITYQAWNGVPAQYVNDPVLRTFNSAGAERTGEPYDNEIDNYSQNHYLLHYKYAFAPQWLLQLNGHYTRGYGYFEQYKADQRFERYGLEPLLVADTVIEETDLIRQRWLDNHFYGATFAVRRDSRSDAGTYAMAGGALSRYIGDHFGKVIWSEWPAGNGKDYRYYDNTAAKLDANLYVKAQKQFTPQLNAYLDLQGRMVGYDFVGFNQNLEPATQRAEHRFFNPKAGLTYTFSDFLSAYAFCGIGHREPNRDDYTQSSPSSRPLAERLSDSEMGIRFGKDGLTLAANIYYMQYKNQLIPDGRINDVGAYIRTNVPDSYRAGIELEAALSTGNWQFAGNTAISRNRVRSFTEYRDNWDTGGQDVIEYRNTDLAFSPELIARGEVGCTLLDKDQTRLALTAIGKYVGSQFLDNTGSSARLDAFLVSDLRLNIDFPWMRKQKGSFILTCNNWLNEQYANNGWVYRFTSTGYDPRPDDPYSLEDGAGVYRQTGLFPQAGRNWMGTLRLEF